MKLVNHIIEKDESIKIYFDNFEDHVSDYGNMCMAAISNGHLKDLDVGMVSDCGQLVYMGPLRSTKYGVFAITDKVNWDSIGKNGVGYYFRGNDNSGKGYYFKTIEMSFTKEISLTNKDLECMVAKDVCLVALPGLRDRDFDVYTPDDHVRGMEGYYRWNGYGFVRCSEEGRVFQ